MSFKEQASTGHFYTSVYNQLCKYVQKLWFLSLVIYCSLDPTVQHATPIKRLHKIF